MRLDDGSMDTDPYAQLVKSLTNQSPTESAIASIEAIRATAIDLGGDILSLVPPSRERSLAITKLEEVVMWAVKGVVLS